MRVKREFVCPTVLLLHAIFMDLMLHLGLQTEKIEQFTSHCVQRCCDCAACSSIAKGLYGSVTPRSPEE